MNTDEQKGHGKVGSSAEGSGEPEAIASSVVVGEIGESISGVDPSMSLSLVPTTSLRWRRNGGCEVNDGSGIGTEPLDVDADGCCNCISTSSWRARGTLLSVIGRGRIDIRQPG